METKTIKWWQSRNVWVGVVAVLIAGYNSACTSFGLPVIPEFIYGILGAMGIYTRINATGAVK